MPTVRPSRANGGEDVTPTPPPTPPTPPTPPPGRIEVEFEEEPAGGGAVIPFDFASVARLIDVVAGHDPERLPLQLRVLWESSLKEEARRALRAAVTCRDPLSDLGTICRDALRTLADLERLARAKNWLNLAAGIGHQDPRASALHNACEFEIGQYDGRKLARLVAIRARLEDAARTETAKCSGKIQAYAGIRAVRCPDIWALYEQWIDTE